jgi:hypothetical protein
MKNQKEDIVSHLVTAIVMVLFFFLLPLFSVNPDRQLQNTNHFESATEFRSSTQNAISIEATEAPVIQTCWLSLMDKIDVSLLNEKFRRAIENNSIQHRFMLLQNITLLIKPTIQFRFYEHLFPIDPADDRS